MRAKLTRRAAILGGAALLPGCSVLDPILGERKVPLPGERRSVLTPEPPVRADEAARPVSLRRRARRGLAAGGGQRRP
jgi:hypothetical protein